MLTFMILALHYSPGKFGLLIEYVLEYEKMCSFSSSLLLQILNGSDEIILGNYILTVGQKESMFKTTK